MNSTAQILLKDQNIPRLLMAIQLFLKAFPKKILCRKPHRTWCSETDGQKNVGPL